MVETVVLVHGFFKGPTDMRYLADYFAGAGYEVVIPKLPTTFGTLRECSTRFSVALDALSPTVEKRLHLVGHSMGGLIIRHYLSQRVVAGLGRCVLIAPPNGGSALADLWRDLLIVWLAVLIQMRSRQNPRRDWSWTLPLAFVLVAVAWIAPLIWALSLMATHPLVALWILDRELRRSRPELRGAYHACLACLPVVIGILCWRLADMPSLPGNDVLTMQITNQAGADLLRGVSSHLVLATHSFLQMIHYGVWLIAIPLFGLRTAPWRIHPIPLARRTAGWRLPACSPPAG